MHRYRLCAVATAVLAAACSERSTPAVSSGGAEVDSAGVRIVESPARADLPRWSVDATPTTIGVVEGPADYTLHRVGSGRVLPDGRIVIANNRTELRFYDRDGVHLRTVGRRGEGPGEFRDIGGLVLARDTLFVYDRSNQRLTFLSPAGEVLGSAPSGAAGVWVGSRASLAAVPDAGLVFTASGFSVPRRDSVGLFRVRFERPGRTRW
jgi:hypothetical protein